MIVNKSLSKINIIPDIEGIAREMTTKSQIAIVVGRVLSLSFGKMIVFAINNIPYIFKILSKDFATGIKVLVELEILSKKDLTKNSYISLHPQMTDMAIALNSPQLIEYFFKLALKYNLSPSVITYNIGPFIKFLSRIENVPDNLIIQTPIDDKKYVMNPNYEHCIEYLENSSLKFSNLKVYF